MIVFQFLWLRSDHLIVVNNNGSGSGVDLNMIKVLTVVELENHFRASFILGISRFLNRVVELVIILND
jgi:hypothetical protein